MKWTRVAAGGTAALGALAAYDLTQKKHAILRNFPVIGHLRFTLERFGPELRQYIVTSNDEERPFSRDQRRWVYASSKLENNYLGFGTDNDVENAEGYAIIKHRTFAGPGAPTAAHVHEEATLPSGKVLGGPRGRRHAFRPQSVVDVSGMSFGALSGNAIEALNRGAAAASRRTRSWPSRSAPTWSTSVARPCSRSAASRHRSATPTTAPSAWPPRTRASPGGWTRP
jgi:glutamate synthase (ferredoxin)